MCANARARSRRRAAFSTASWRAVRSRRWTRPEPVSTSAEPSNAHGAASLIARRASKGTGFGCGDGCGRPKGLRCRKVATRVPIEPIRLAITTPSVNDEYSNRPKA